MDVLNTKSKQILVHYHKIIKNISVLPNKYLLNEPFNNNYGENFHFIPLNIQKYIKQMKNGIVYKFQTSKLKKNIELTILFPQTVSLKNTHTRRTTSSVKNRKTICNKLKKHQNTPITIAKRVFTFLSFFEKLKDVNISCSKTLKIFLYFTSFTKKTPKTLFEKINENHVNTGFTFGCAENNEIYIYREEEWEKVLLHECIHAFGIDYSNNTSLNEKINRIILSKHNIQEEYIDLRSYELYTELCGNILNILFSSQNISIVYEKIQKEQKWAICQCSKIMKYYKNNLQNVVINKMPPIYCYYFLKCGALYNINSFFDIIHLNGLVFQQTPIFIEKYVKFIYKCISNEQYYLIPNYNGCNEFNVDTSCINSLRMTITGNT
jgi:hypothetical protein